MTRSLNFNFNFSFLLLTLLVAFAGLTNALTITNARYTILSPDGEQLRSEKLSISESTSQPTLTLRPSDTLKLSFTVLDAPEGTPVQPHQTFLRFFDPQSGEEGIQPVRVSPSGKAKFDLIMSRPPPSLPPTTSTPLTVTLLLGSFTHPPSSLPLFSLALPPSQPPPSHPDEDSFHPLPEIHHTFRAEQKTAPKVVSMVFTGVVLAPWVGLVGMLSPLPLSLPHLTSLTSPPILPFLLSLLACEALLLWYWLALNLGQVLAYGSVLGLITAATGNWALAGVAGERVGVNTGVGGKAK